MKRPDLSAGYVHAGSSLGFGLANGHVAVLRLVTRWYYLNRKGGLNERDVLLKFDVPGFYVTTFRGLTERVCGRPLGMIAEWEQVRKDEWVQVGIEPIGREDLFKLAKFLVAMIDAIKPTEYDADWFPDGWQDSRDLVLGRRVKEIAAPKMVATPMRERGESHDSLVARHAQYMRDNPDFAKELTG